MSVAEGSLPIETVGAPETKVCIYCKVPKPLLEFPEHYFYKGGYDSRCKGCIRERSKFVRQVKKFAPERPDKCDIEGCVNRATQCDHDPAIRDPSRAFRGWLCDFHNKTLGLLGDDLDGLQAQCAAYVKYLLRARERNG